MDAGVLPQPPAVSGVGLGCEPHPPVDPVVACVLPHPPFAPCMPELGCASSSPGSSSKRENLRGGGEGSER